MASIQQIPWFTCLKVCVTPRLHLSWKDLPLRRLSSWLQQHIRSRILTWESSTSIRDVTDLGEKVCKFSICSCQIKDWTQKFSIQHASLFFLWGWIDLFSRGKQGVSDEESCKKASTLWLIARPSTGHLPGWGQWRSCLFWRYCWDSLPCKHSYAFCTDPWLFTSEEASLAAAVLST